jgi:DNA-binding NarL/FixJ family response regulator
VRIIVVDDSSAVRARLVALLQDAKVDVLAEASDIDTALELTAIHDPDAIVLDLQMPGRSALEALRLIRRLPSPPRVVVLSNQPHPSHRAACLRHGADFVFDKSTEVERVIEALAGTMAPKS